jgi:hypothetical protein
MGLTAVTSAASRHRIARARDWLNARRPAEEVGQRENQGSRLILRKSPKIHGSVDSTVDSTTDSTMIVGIIRSPVRASILPDARVMSVYGTQ